MSTNVRKGYQTKQFTVDNLYNGLGDKQAKRSHFRANGVLNKAPKSKRKSKNNNNESASQLAVQSEVEYDHFDYYSQGSAISDDENDAIIGSDPNPSSGQPEHSSSTSFAQPVYKIITSSPESDSLLPILHQLSEMLASGQISDLNSFISDLYGETGSRQNSTNIITNFNSPDGPITQILSHVM